MTAILVRNTVVPALLIAGSALAGCANLHKPPAITYDDDAQPAVRVCLHARRLGFVHPLTGLALEFVSECPF